MFKFYHPFVKRNTNNTLSLVAHGREVISDPLKDFIPEFQDEFQEELDEKKRTFIVRAYVFGDLLDRTVSLERCTFDFVDDNDLHYGISRKQIEAETANEVKRIMSDVINRRIEEKKDKVDEYVNKTAPWYKSIVNDVDLSCLPTNPSEDAIDHILHEHSYNRTKATSAKVDKILRNSSVKNLQKDIAAIVSEIQKVNKDDLIQYMARRKAIISLFEKSLECDDKDQYIAENVLHDIIFPRHNTTDDLQYEKHNLWLIDERLNYSDYISSDVAINREDRPDLMVCYDGRISFREGNDKENPISIFEFKKTMEN